MTHQQLHAAVDVVVPVHGGWDFVRRCLESLRAQTIPVNVYVVDDCSPDDTPDLVSDHFSWVTLIRNEKNVGFAATCNAGIRAGVSPTVILLNSDVEAVSTMAEELSHAIASRPSAGSASGVLLQPDGRVDAYGITADVTLAGFVRFHGSDLTAVDDTDPANVGPYGALAAYRRAALDDVGLLDENIFMYGEELELAFRLGASGWGTVLVKSALGTHLGGASAGEGSARQRYLAGFGRGYILRVYDIARTRHALRALLVELLVTVRGLLIHGDSSQARGRIAGWRRGRDIPKRRASLSSIDTSIGIVKSLQMRDTHYWEMSQ